MSARARLSMTRAETSLYYYAISCALSALVTYAGSFGRGWYHYADGAVIIASEIAL